MKAFALTGIALSLLGSSPSLHAVDLATLKLLYVGEPANSMRARQIAGFLHDKVSEVKAVERRVFTPRQADGFDVVLLDWPQSGNTEAERQKGSPLGPRSGWHKPTVLLGSAGLNMAIVWKVRGGSG
jgi:hypothetical protein